MSGTRPDEAAAGHRVVQTASHWGVYGVEVDPRGNVVATRPFAADPHPSELARGLPEAVRSELRIDRPYVRAGYLRRRSEAPHDRGREPFVAVTWEAALDLVAAELRRVRELFGNGAVYGGSHGWASAGRLHHAPSVLKRFLGLYGGYVDRFGNHSFGAALGIMPHVVGRADIPNLAVPWPAVVDHARLVVMFGGAHPKNAQIESGGTATHESADWLRRAAAARIAFVNVSPSRQDLASHLGGEWWPIRPNTDVALMLGLAHTLATERLHDQAFLARCCTGYPRFERYLLGEADGVAKDADWAARITGLDAGRIRGLARRMAATRTLVATSWSVQRADHGEQPVWMTVVLAAMLGQIGLPGGGFSLGLGAMNGIASPRPPAIPLPSLPIGPNAVRTGVPTGRVADLLLEPGTELAYNGTTVRLPRIRLVYAAGGNPFHHSGNLNRFLRAWRQPDTIVVHEPWWTPAARHADIVLPSTTTMERNDIQAAHLSRFYVAMRQVVEPFAQSRNDFDIFAELAGRLGFAGAYTEGRDEMGWLRHMYEEARKRAQERGFDPPPFDRFWQLGAYEFPLPAAPADPFEAFRADPAGHRLNTPSGRIEIFSAAVDAFGYEDCPGHPAWIEPGEWLGSAKARRYPLHLLSNQPAARLHSQLDPCRSSRDSKVREREPLHIHARDAAARGISDGDVVRVYNDRGAFLAGAVVVDHLAPGVLQIATGAWYDPAEPGVPGSLEKHGNPNVVTPDTGTSRLAQGPAVQTALVEVERCDDPPPVTAFERPPLLERADAAAWGAGAGAAAWGAGADAAAGPG